MGIIPAQRRNQRITFSRAASAGRSALGSTGAASWISFGSRFASVLYGTSAERREAGVERAVMAATFRTLADTVTKAVTVQDRIEHLGLSYDITGIAPIGRAEFEFTGTAVRS